MTRVRITWALRRCSLICAFVEALRRSYNAEKRSVKAGLPPLIEKSFDIAFVAQMAQREKQIQQNYRPVIGVHKWFDAVTGHTLSRLLLSEFDSEEPLATSLSRP